jgi:protein-disulfide isomerase
MVACNRYPELCEQEVKRGTIMRSKFRITLFSVLLIAGFVSNARAAEFSDSQRKEMEGIIKEYLLAHPELITEMSQILEEKQKQAEDELRKKALVANADQIFRNKGDHVAGNPKGKVTMVEFFDYNCGWCKKGFPEVVSLVDSDEDLRFVLKEFPIFGEDSEYAAKAALASERQGKYWKLHIAMFSHGGKITKSAVDEIAAAQGLDMVKLKKDMEDPVISQTILQNRALAQSLAINGTPAFIIDDKVIPGYLPGPELAAAIDDVRAKGGCALC